MWTVFFQLCAAASPEPGGDTEHLRLFEFSRSAETRGEYPRAYRACSAAIMANPHGSRVPYCSRRLAWMDARRSTGGSLDALEAFQSIRARYTTLGREASKQQVLVLDERTDLSATLASDVRLWLARDALNHGPDPEQAVAHLEPLWQRRGTLPEASAREVGLVFSNALAAAGRLERSREVESTLRTPDTENTMSITERYETLQRRRDLGLLSGVCIALYGVLSTPAFLRGLPLLRRVRPIGVVILGVACAGAALLTYQWEPGSGASLIWLLLGASVMHIWTLAALQHPHKNRRPRWIRAGAFVSTVGLGYLALYCTDTLMWVGL